MFARLPTTMIVASLVAATTPLLYLMLTSVAVASERSPAVYSPAVRAETRPTRLLWGDTHLHTNLSGDAYMTGTTVFGPEQAYRFARGEQVISTTGVPAKLRAPLDFLVVSDHAEFLGLFAATAERDAGFLATDLGRRWRKFMDDDDMASMFKDFQRMIFGDDPDRSTAATKLSMWQRVAKLADAYNEPGRFSALIGFEWSSTPGNSNLHRNVIFKDGAEVAGSVVPFTAVDGNNPADLWRFMSDYEQATGGRVLAIPHNGNLSNGLMFAETTLAGDPIDADYARQRARWEPIVEVTQMKGDGETHPLLSPDDAFSDFETWDAGNFSVREGAAPKQDWMLQYEYARSALKLGLKLQQSLGVNPYQFGMIGSSDAHTGLAAVAEDDFFGKFAESEPNPKRAASNMEWLGWSNAKLAASGLAAVWATDNTRAAIFEAMQRKEVYASTGPRIGLRLFAGWQFQQGDEQRSDVVDYGYGQGVPMGGSLSAPPSHLGEQDLAPSFVVLADKDPQGANLDRLQIVKGWLTAAGELREQVFDIAVSGNRAINPIDHRAPALPASVDLSAALYRNTHGDSELRAFWRDPDFRPSELAFYYVRVLQIPTPRWPSYDRQVFGTEPAADAQLILQDRAYSSPVWFTPIGDKQP